MDPPEHDLDHPGQLAVKPSNRYGDTIVGDGAHAHLGDVSQDVNIQGNVSGGLHLHFNAQPQDLSIVAVIYTFTQVTAVLRRLGRGFQHHSHFANWEDVRSLRTILKRLSECILQLRSVDSSPRPVDAVHPSAGKTLRDLSRAALQEALAIRELLNPLARKLDEGPVIPNLGLGALADSAEGKAWLVGELQEKYVEDTIKIFRSLYQNDGDAVGGLQWRLQAAKRYEKRLQAQLESRIEGDPDAATGPVEFSLDFVDQIKSTLYFREESDRLVEVKEAHKNTFGWIFEAHDQKPPHMSKEAYDSLKQFCPWLEHGDKCFWVNGKAGSGKSTLMKYLYQHKATTQLLKSWAASRQLIVCTFFFWYAGKPLQRSQEGVLRAILFRILDARPSLTPVVFPRLSRYVLCKGRIADLNITPRELHEAMELLAKNMPSDLAVFMLVDGVDEYTGDQFDFSKFLISLVENPSIKLLVSSRPIPVCYQIFSRFPNIRLQDLTAGDIRAYVECELIQDPLFVEMNMLERGFVQEVREALTDKSSGVFLWIVLVVRRLLIGLGNYENRERLLEIIDELPNDLLQLYDHMFRQMSDEHQREGSLLFQLVVRAREAQPCPLTALQLLAAFHPGVLPTPTPECNQLSTTDELLRVKAMDGKLRSRCCGLIEVQYSDIKGALKHPKVDFLHRTVYDYLHDGDVWIKVTKLNELSQDSVDLMLLAGCVFEVQRRSLARTPKGQIMELPIDLFTACLAYSDGISVSGDQRYVEYLKAADTSFMQCCKLSIAPLMPYQQACKGMATYRRYDLPDEQTSFVQDPGAMLELGAALAVAKLGMPAYLASKLSSYGGNAASDSLLMLYLLALIKVLPDQSPFVERYASNVQILIDRGTDPNTKAKQVSSTDVPILLLCAKTKEMFSSPVISPWEFWVVEQEPVPAHVNITLQLLRAGKQSQASYAGPNIAFSQLYNRLEMYRTEHADDTQLADKISEILGKLGLSGSSTTGLKQTSREPVMGKQDQRHSIISEPTGIPESPTSPIDALQDQPQPTNLRQSPVVLQEVSVTQNPEQLNHPVSPTTWLRSRFESSGWFKDAAAEASNFSSDIHARKHSRREETLSEVASDNVPVASQSSMQLFISELFDGSHVAQHNQEPVVSAPGAEDYMSQLFDGAWKHESRAFRLDGSAYGLNQQQVRQRKRTSRFKSWLSRVFGWHRT